MNRSLKISLFGYTIATTVHFFHNALFLRAYPNMPAAISQIDIFALLMAVLAIGALGSLIYF